MPALQAADKADEDLGAILDHSKEEIALVCSLLRLDLDFKMHQLVLALREIDAGPFLKIELRDVCRLQSRVRSRQVPCRGSRDQLGTDPFADAVRQHFA